MGKTFTEAMHFRQAYWKVKMDLAWLQEEARDKINIYEQLQTEMPTGSRQLTWKWETGKGGVGYWGVVGSVANWEAHGLLIVFSGLSPFEKVAVVAELSDFEAKPAS